LKAHSLLDATKKADTAVATVKKAAFQVFFPPLISKFIYVELLNGAHNPLKSRDAK
jgi:hypothetical protein